MTTDEGGGLVPAHLAASLLGKAEELRGRALDLDPHSLIGKRVRLNDGRLGKVEGVLMHVSVLALRAGAGAVFSNAPGSVDRTTLDVKVDGSLWITVPVNFSDVEFVEETFVEPTQGDYDGESKENPSITGITGPG